MNTMSAPVKKPERTTCRTCGLEAPAPIVVDGKCANEAACKRRTSRIPRKKA